MLSSGFNARSKFNFSVIFGAVLSGCLALLSSPAMAVEVASPVDCAGTINPNLSCTSNDIKINEVSQMTVGEGGTPVETCEEGEMGVVDIKLTTQLNATGRYDVLTWFGTEGNDPRGTDTDACHVTSLPDNPPSAFILDLELGADACLDVNSSPDPVVQYMVDVPFTCIDEVSLDPNGDVVNVPDGEADVIALVTWFQNNSLVCGTGGGQSMEPGVNPKCDVSLLLDLDILIVSNPNILITKTPDTQEVESGGTAEFTITVTNIGDVDLDTVDVTDLQCDADPVGPTGDVGSDNVLSVDEVWQYTCSTSNVTSGFINTASVTAEVVESDEEVSAQDTATVTVPPPPPPPVAPSVAVSTLNKYGLILMALLMLGVGIAGYRKFS